MATSNTKKSAFDILNAINVNKHTEKKNGLTYLSWAWAWAEVKKAFPDANYTVYERPDGCNYFTDGRTCWVKTGVTVDGIEHIEYLPVMDYKNKSIMLEQVTSFDVNKAIQRSLTKALARHGLGLYIYAGEDLPEPICDQCKQFVKEYNGNTAQQVVNATKKAFGKCLCMDCANKLKKDKSKEEAEIQKKRDEEAKLVGQTSESMEGEQEVDDFDYPFPIPT